MLTLNHGFMCYKGPRTLNKVLYSIHPDKLGNTDIVEYNGKKDILYILSRHDDDHDPLYLEFSKKSDAELWRSKVSLIKKKIAEKVEKERNVNRRRSSFSRKPFSSNNRTRSDTS